MSILLAGSVRAMLYPVDEREREELRARTVLSRSMPRRPPPEPEPGGSRIVGHRGRGPAGCVRSDRRIFEDVCEALTVADDIDASGIEVEIDSGVVRLRGAVRTQREQWRAQDVAESCAGVRHVINDLHVWRER